MLIFLSYLKDRIRHSRREKCNLSRFLNSLQDSLYIISESHIKHLISFIKHYCTNCFHLHCITSNVIHYTSRGSDYDLNSIMKISYLPADILSAIHCKDLYPMHIFGKFMKFFGRLHCKFSCWAENKCLKASLICIYLLKYRKPKCCRFSCSGLSLAYNITPCKKYRYSRLLNRSHILISHFVYCTKDLRIKICIAILFTLFVSILAVI